jgi:hypothetical protein
MLVLRIALDEKCWWISEYHSPRSLIRHPIQVSLLKSAGFGRFLIASKVLDVRRRGATTEAYGAIRRPSTLLRAVSLSNGR